MRTLYLIATVVVTLSSLGCLVPYAYPKLDYTEPVKFDCPAGEVHAFRVDITRHRIDLPDLFGQRCLTELPVNHADEVSAQVQPSVTYGYYVFGGAVNFPVETNHEIELKLYRPGYKLVEIGSWQPVDRIDWKPAPDFEAQVEALNGLVGFVEPGSASPANRSALHFAASEYERLATLALEGKGCKSYLTTEAGKLRQRADE
jgi:hypothetical protein